MRFALVTYRDGIAAASSVMPMELPLPSHFQSHGHSAEFVAWDDDAVDWAAFDWLRESGRRVIVVRACL
jgi:hypothetical protein